MQVTPHNWCRVTPFGHPGITARLTAPPGLSRPPTSFIGSWCQGIHRAPLSTWRLQLMLASTVQFSRYGRPRSKTLPHPRQGATAREKTRPKPVPSGPNSVLSRTPAAATLPPPAREAY